MEAQQTIVFIDFERLIANVDKAACDKLREYFPNQTRELEEPDSRSNFEIASQLPNKLQQKLEKIYSEKGLISNVSPFPNALNALHQMKSYGIDIKIVMNHNLLGEKTEWIGTKLGADWIERIVVIKDKTLLKGDYFLDTQPIGSATIWKQFIVNTSYNKARDFGSDLRMSSLMDWKKILENQNKDNTTNANTMSEKPYIAFFRHGSEDSRDIDVLYQFDKMPDNESILNFERGSGDEDRNIFTIDPIANVVKECHRGIPDEVNNALLATYDLHKQSFPLPIKRKLPRSVITRTAVCIRVILITLRRIESIREKIIEALNSTNLKKRADILQTIDLTKLGDHLDKDDWKLIAFHLTQTFWLMQGKELYTKKEILKKSFEVKKFINREQEKYSERELNVLEEKKRDVIGEFNDDGMAVIINKDNLNMFKAGEEGRSMNLFLSQCTGTVIDIRTERTVFWPCTDPVLNEACSWPTSPDTHPMSAAILNTNFNYIGVFEHEGKCWICSPKFKVLQRDDTKTKELDLSKYWYVFAQDGVNNKLSFGELLAVIDRVTLSFVDEQIFKEQLERFN